MTGKFSATPRYRGRMPLVLWAMGGIAILAGGCNSEAETAASTPPQPVQVMTVTFEPEVAAWSYVGTIQPRYETDLAFRVGGKVLERRVEIGQRVEAGQVIARLDPADFELALAAQEAELGAARTSREEAAAALGRYEILVRQGHVSKAALDQRTSAAAEAASRVERAERTTALARNQLAYATLNADRDGVIETLPVEVGQVVTAGQVVTRLARLDQIEVEVAIPEQKLDSVRSATAEVELWAEGGQRLPATLREVSPQADAISRTFRARFAIADRSLAVDLGRTATLYLHVASTDTLAAVPLSAVMDSGKGPIAWVVSKDGTRAIPTVVEVGGFEQDRAIIKSGLRAGDRIVTLGTHMLDPDKQIRVIEQKSAQR